MVLASIIIKSLDESIKCGMFLGLLPRLILCFSSIIPPVMSSIDVIESLWVRITQ